MDFLGVVSVFFAFIISMVVTGVDIIKFLRTGRQLTNTGIRIFSHASVIIFVMYVLASDWDARNSCCGSTALFSPEHRLSVGVLSALIGIAYIYSYRKNKVAPPVVEVLVNCLLLIGIVLATLVGIQEGDFPLGLFFSFSPVTLLIFALVKNHRLALESLEPPDPERSGKLTMFCWDLLHIRPLQKFPLLLIIFLPLLVVLIGILLVFGQQPDSLIRAFTDTYHRGLSQINDQCNGMVCGGHFLCTIAAKGHPGLVRPVRLGVRAGRSIKCNRQLLISNAFEELLEQRAPAIHRPVRRLYNRIGAGIHRYYGAFDHKWVSDLIYILMKPLEWIFLLSLYTFDRKPENRIARQYTAKP